MRGDWVGLRFVWLSRAGPAPTRARCGWNGNTITLCEAVNPDDECPLPCAPAVPRFATLIALLFLALPMPTPAQNAIHRCVGTDGRPVYTDQACSSVGATSTMPPPVSRDANGTNASGPSASLLCAKDLPDLREAMAHAFALQNANRIGGLTLWGGGSASDNMRSLDALVHQRLVSLEGSEAAGIDAVTAGPGGGESTRRTHFGVVRDAGCLWLRPPG